MLSAAFALTEIDPDTVALLAGLEMETVGNVVSAGAGGGATGGGTGSVGGLDPPPLTGLLTVTLTDAEVAELPLVSRATAVNE